MRVVFTVGAAALYDVRPPGTCKAIGGSVWLTREGARNYVNSITIKSVPLRGAIYEVLLPAPVESCSIPHEGGGDWRVLNKPALIGSKVEEGTDPWDAPPEESKSEDE